MEFPIGNEANVEEAVFEAIERTNELLPAGTVLAKRRAEALAGTGSKLDSMGLVNFIFAVEQEMNQRFGVEVSVASAHGRDGADPLLTVDTLIKFLVAMINRRK